MSMTFGVRDLIDANRKGLLDRTLGAIIYRPNYPSQYVYDDGCRCAIGIVLPESVAANVAKSSKNDMAIRELLKLEMVFDPYWVFWFTQRLHDAWAQRVGFGMERYDYQARTDHGGAYGPLHPELWAFLHWTQASVEPVNEATFRTWIDHLDRLYPAEGATS